MGINLTEEQLSNLLKKNPSLKVAETLGGKQQKNKIDLSNISNKSKDEKIVLDFGEPPTKKKKSKPTDIKKINNTNLESHYEFTYSDTHFSILFHNAQLLSVNQIFAILQSGKYKIFSYKKKWHNIIKKVLYEAYIQARAEGKNIPFFHENAEITLFRQASRLVDEDAMTTMFKYILDGLKREDDNPHGILADDNPKIIHKIICYSNKGEPKIGIKVKLCEERKQDFSAEDILKK